MTHDSELAWSEAAVVFVVGIQAALATNKFSIRLPMPIVNVDKVISEGMTKRLIPKEVAKVIGAA